MFVPLIACAVVGDKVVTLSSAVTRAVERVMLSDKENLIMDIMDWNILPPCKFRSNVARDNSSREKRTLKQL